MKSKNLHRFLPLCIAVAIASQVEAATVTKAATGTDLTAGASWAGTAPTSADIAAWVPASLGAGLTLNSAAAWNGINATGALSAINITGTGTLTLGSLGIDAAASAVGLTISNPITLADDQSWMTNAGTTITASGNITGNFALTAGSAVSTKTYSNFIPTAATTIFPNTDLAQINAVGGNVGGAYVNSGTPLPGTAYFFTNNGTTASYQLQVLNNETKAVLVTLTQVGPDVQAVANWARYKNGNQLGTDFSSGATSSSVATSSGSAGYGVASTTVTLGKIANGTVRLSGTNSYTGKTTAVSGVLHLAKPEALYGANTASWTDTMVDVKSAATLALSVGGPGEFTTSQIDTVKSLGTATGGFESGAILGLDTTNAGGSFTHGSAIGNPNAGANVLSITKLGAGNLILTGANTYTGTTTLADGKLILNSADPQTLPGRITGPGALEHAGPGTLTLSGANDFTGGITISGGWLTAGNSAALGQANAAASTVIISNGGTLDINGKNLIYGMTIAGDGADGNGALVNTGANLATNTGQTSNLTLTADAKIGGTGNFGMLANGAVAITLDLAGHTFTKSGTNTFYTTNTTITAGNVHVAEGTFSLFSAAGTAANAAFTLSAGATLNLNNLSYTTGSLEGGGGTVSLGTARLTTGALGTTTTYSGNITGTGTTGGLTKTGAGELTLAGTCSHTGTTVVNGGKLIVTGGLTGNTSVTVGATETFQLGDGTIGNDCWMTFRPTTNGTTNSINGTGSVELNDEIDINLAGATVANGNSWNLVNVSTLNETYGPNFEVTGFTESTPGVWTVENSGNTWTFTEATGTLTVQMPGFATWASTNAPGQTMDQDHDGDGVSNGVEYFMGLSGNAFTANPAPDANHKVAWPKGASYTGTYGTDYAVQSSTDLDNWTDVSAENVTDGNPLEYTIPTGSPARFVRLKVNGP